MPARARADANPPTTLRPTRCTSGGRYHFYKGTPDEFAIARQYLEQAIARDPRFALAYDGLAEMYWYVGFLGGAPAREVTATGLFCALHALDIDDSLAETHALLGLYRKEHDFNWGEVKREMDRALQLNPSSAIVKVRYAMGWLLVECRLRDAIREIESALETDPLSTFMRAWLGCMLWLDRQYDRAVEQARLMIDIEPANFLGHWQLGLYLRECKLYESSIAAHQRAMELSAGSLLVLGWLGLAFGEAKRHAEAREVLAQLQAAVAHTYVPPTSLAWTALGLGDVDQAFLWMDRAIEGCDHMIMPIQSYPFLDPIRADRRYGDLLRKLKMKPTGGVCTES